MPISTWRLFSKSSAQIMQCRKRGWDLFEHMFLENLFCRRHTEWSVNRLRKSPGILPCDTLRRYLVLENGNAHPVLETLGGVAWLQKIEERENTPIKEYQRSVRACQHCRLVDGMTAGRFSRCSGCKQVYYWYVAYFSPWGLSNSPCSANSSKKCQQADWKRHK